MTCTTARHNFTTADVTALYDHINREASPPKPQNVDPARTAANRARRTSKKRKGRKIQCTIIAAALRTGGHVDEWSREQMTAIETATAAEDAEWPDDDWDAQVASGSGASGSRDAW